LDEFVTGSNADYRRGGDSLRIARRFCGRRFEPAHDLTGERSSPPL